MDRQRPMNSGFFIIPQTFNIRAQQMLPQRIIRPTPTSSQTQTHQVKCDAYILRPTVSLTPNRETYTLSFQYTSDYPVKFQIFFFVQQVPWQGKLHYYVDPNKNYPPPQFMEYPPGKNQPFQIPFCDISRIDANSINFVDKRTYPLMIDICPIYPDKQKPSQSLATFFVFTQSHPNFQLRAHRQKFVYNGNTYQVQEVYGLLSDDSQESECVICLCEAPTTAIMPCRHVCICDECAVLMKQQNRSECPVCRGPIHHYMSVKVRK